MSKSKEYKAIKNYIHNELGLSKKDIVDEIRPLLPELMKQYMNATYGSDSDIEYWVKVIVRNEVENHLGYDGLKRLIKDVIAEELKSRLDINVKIKGR